MVRRDTQGHDQTLIKDPRLTWPDNLSLATDGYLYITANQVNRMPRFHDGKDLRTPPYYLFKLKVDAKPVMLKK